MVIPRYTTAAMQAIWSDENKFRLWVIVESAVLRARVALGHIKVVVPSELPESLVIDPEEIDRIERDVTGHDVVAFLQHTAPQLPDAVKPWWHHNLTSYDIEDTALCLQLRASVDVVVKSLLELMRVMQLRAYEHRFTPMIGRTHGVHAEPITLGVKLANWHAECKRQLDQLNELRRIVSVGKISGAVGMYTLPPEVEEHVCMMLGLRPITATQIISRDIHSLYADTFTRVGSELEKFAFAVRLGQQTERRELQESFRQGQRGSSKMPHKKNPIRSENVCSLSRALRGYQVMASQNINTMDERSLDNSAVERIYLPDISNLVDFMLQRFTKIVEGLNVSKDRMHKNLALTKGVIFSGDVMGLIAARSEMPQQDAYELVYKIAQRCWDQEKDFLEALRAEPTIMEAVTDDELTSCFDLPKKIEHVNHIFNREFGGE